MSDKQTEAMQETDAEKIRAEEQMKQEEISKEIKEATGVKGQYGACLLYTSRCV